MFFLLPLILPLFVVSPNQDSYTVEDFYKKVELDYGTLDEEGNSIDFIYVKTEIENGTYNIELEDVIGDLYQIKNTSIFLKLSGYFGYAGYGTECVLKVKTYGSYVVKLE